jgi:hypothetical protein
MSVPNEYQFVCDVVGPRLAIVGDEEETRANSFWACNDGCVQIRQKDPRWGLLIKTGGAQVENRAADIWAYDLGNGTLQVVDMISNAEGAPPPEGGARTPPGPAWSEKDIRSISEWVVPYNDMPAPGPDPGPSGDTVTVPTAAAFEKLKADIASLDERLMALEANNGNTGFPSRIALRTWRGRYVVAVNDEAYSVAADRESAGAWETFDVEPK